MTDSLVAALRELGISAENIAEYLTIKYLESAVPRGLLKPSEAATWLGFTESAMNQAPWKKDIPVVMVGVQKRYRLKDLEAFAENHLKRQLR